MPQFGLHSIEEIGAMGVRGGGLALRWRAEGRNAAWLKQ